MPLESWRDDFCPIGATHFARAGTAGGLVFFSADDGVHDQELWKSDQHWAPDPEDEGTYCPDKPVTRAEMAVFLTRTFLL